MTIERHKTTTKNAERPQRDKVTPINNYKKNIK